MYALRVTAIAARDWLRSIPRRMGLVRRKPLPQGLRTRVLLRDEYRCRYCGISPYSRYGAYAPEIVLQVDHVHPWIKGGSDKIENLVTACRPCNLAKGAKTL